ATPGPASTAPRCRRRARGAPGAAGKDGARYPDTGRAAPYLSARGLSRGKRADEPTSHHRLTAGYLDRQTLHPTEAGTPQGGPLSPVAANLTLDGLEPLLRA